MASLVAKHRGYKYQDLLVACRLVDVLLGSVVQVHSDTALRTDPEPIPSAPRFRKRVSSNSGDAEKRQLTWLVYARIEEILTSISVNVDRLPYQPRPAAAH
jgi:hypothetical protein